MSGSTQGSTGARAANPVTRATRRPVVPRWVEEPIPGEEWLRMAVREHTPIGVIQGLAAGRLQAEDLLWKGYWALAGESIVKDVDHLFHNRRLLEAAANLFDGAIAVPVDMVVNVSAPMRAGFPHVDTPSFRGIDILKVPAWFIEALLVSNRFERWRVKVAGALMWSYSGIGGEFEYWPEGPEAPSQRVTMPSGNRALIADNDVMFHRVCDIGRPEQFRSVSTISPRTTISPGVNGGWTVSEQGATVVTFRADEIRMSMLWRARVYADGREAEIAAKGLDDLSIASAVELLAQDMADRGVSVPLPRDPLRDPEWRQHVMATYGWGPRVSTPSREAGPSSR